MPDSWIFVVILSTAGAVAAGATALTRPRVALAILFLLASMSRATLETSLGTMRPEMPAVAVVALVLLAAGRFSALRSLPRATLAMAFAFGTYLAVLAFSSAFVAPGTAQSLRMVAWLAISMTGGVVAFVLTRPRPMGAIEPLALGGAAMGTIGVAVAAAFFVAGPAFDFGIQGANAILPRVFALGWEANLYASFLAMCTFFALEIARGPRKAVGLLILAPILIGLPLGVTRGAYLGLAAGSLAYVAVRLAVQRRPRDLPRLGAIGASMLLIGVVASNLLLPNALEREPVERGGVAQSVGPAASPEVPTLPGAVPSSISPTGMPVPTSTGAPSPTATLEPYPDTIAFRLERVPIAIADLRNSPLIGFGAESFGQRHPDRYAGAGPDHIAILAVVVPYEAGILGAAALIVAFAFLLSSLWKFARQSGRVGDWRAAGAAAAFIGSLVSVLVAYQANNALHLAINWIVIGAAAALTARHASNERTSSA